MFIYNTGAVAFRDAQFGSGIGPIFLEKLVCSGSETTLLDCRHSTPLGLSTCTHSQDAGVRCKARELPTHSSLNYVALTFSSFVYLQVVIIAALD